MTPAAPASTTAKAEPIPARAGVGLKPIHYETILRERPDIAFFEIHAENYMGAGGPPHRYLTAIRDEYPLSVHGVGLSIGGPDAPDARHLERLRTVVQRYQPGLVSEHLAWAGLPDAFANDLLPLPYTRSNLERTLAHVDQVQETLGRRILIENPSTYLRFEDSDIDERSFLRELAQRGGCGLLLDVNNVYVSARNHGNNAHTYLEDFPFEYVEEVHVAGHKPASDEAGRYFLIDSHDQPVSNEVWQLLRLALAGSGPVPVLLERDGNVPAWQELAAEAAIADAYLQQLVSERHDRQLAHA